MTGALSHIRVLDMSRILAGPWCGQTLADLGAEVIKVERPTVGDDTRQWGPPFIENPDGSCGDSGYYASVNRGKKSVTVDIAHPEGQAIIRDLAAGADVLIENYKVGTLERYGLSYAQLKDANPRLVYCSVTGFGQSGPYAHLPGYDFVFQGMGGLMSYTGAPGEAPAGGPMKVGVAVIDILTGMYAATAILAALEHRTVSGRGQYIDLALLDCAVALSSYHAVNYFLTGRPPVRVGNAHPNMVPYNAFDCLDGQVILAIGNDSQFASFCVAAGHPELAEDHRFREVPGRLGHRDVLISRVAEIMLTRTMREWLVLLGDANVPCGPIYSIPQVFDDSHIESRGMAVTFAGGTPSAITVPGNPMRLSETPVSYAAAPPNLGQDTEEIMARLLAKSPADIARLRAARVI